MTVPYDLILQQRFVNDQAEAPDHELAALVASGDAFITLATQLDAISHRLPIGSERDTIEQVVATLIQLQRQYQITPKRHDYHQ